MNKLFIISALMLSSCAAAQNYAPMVDPHEKQVLIYRPSQFAIPSAQISVNRSLKCVLPAQSYAIVDAGIISAKLSSGVPTVVTIQSSKPHYIKMLYDRQANAGYGFGLIGGLITEATDPTQPGFRMTEVSKEQAKSEITGFSQACN